MTIDKTKYQNPKSIAEGVRKGAENFFNNSSKGKGVKDTSVKKVYKGKIKEN
jgi:hypothetical protein